MDRNEISKLIYTQKFLAIYLHRDNQSLHTTHTEKIMALNPYELRQHLLQQAQRILTDAYHVERDNCRDAGKQCPAPFPTTEDIIKEAEKLYQFVQKK